jgi:retinol dehydrogenase-12
VWDIAIWPWVLVGQVPFWLIWTLILRLFARGGVCRTTANLTDQVAIVTGANTGIGKETTIALVRMGCTVVVASRSADKGTAAVEEVLSITGAADERVQYIQLDLASLESVRRFAVTFKGRFDKLNLLVNNAGVMICPFGKTQDGFEMQFGTNHLGPFLLTLLLLSLITKVQGRVVSLSSFGHHFTDKGIGDMERMQSPDTYNRVTAYGVSKLSNILFTVELQRRIHHTGASAYAVHPGAVRTDLSRHVDACTMITTAPFQKLCYKTPQQGAQTSLHCCVSDAAVPGAYHADCAPAATSIHAKDAGMAADLWSMSERMVGESFEAGSV